MQQLSNEFNTTIPAAWCEVLERVRAEFPKAVIAGGCLRDLDFGKPVKDVDIFIPISCCPDDQFDDALRDMFDAIELMNASVYGHKLKKEFDRQIFACYDVKEAGIDYNIIVTNDHAAQSSTFDFSICQIEFDGTVVKATAEYLETRDTKVIKLVNAYPVHRNGKRLARMQEKFPEMTIDASAMDALPPVEDDDIL